MEKELETLTASGRIYSENMGMECAMQIMKNGKRQMTEGIGLPNQEKIRIFREKET